MPYEISLFYQLDQYLSMLRVVGWHLSFFIEFSVELSIRKQCKPWSDAALYGVRFGSALFDYVPQKGHQAYIG